MLQKVVCLEKSSDKALNYLIKKIDSVKNLSFAVESSKSRNFVHIISNGGDEMKMVELLHHTIADIISIYFKFDYLINNLHYKEINIYFALFISAFVNFDSHREKRQILGKLKNQDEYSLDAIYNFQLQQIKEDWENLVDIANNELVMESKQESVYELVSVMLTSKKVKSESIFIIENENEIIITNPLKGNLIEVHNLFDDRDFNALFTIIKENPGEIIFDRKCVGRRLFLVASQIFKTKLI